jgi:diguanylate cyclase (GGDEF)-like protein
MKNPAVSPRATGATLYVLGALVMLAYLVSCALLHNWTGAAVSLAALLAFGLAYPTAICAPVATESRPGPNDCVDALTGVATRPVLFQRLDAALASARRRRHDVAVLYVDFDGMRAVNDRAGHAAGDRVLAEMGARLRAAVRSDETVARVGGDEFVVLLPHVEKYNEPEEAARRIGRLFTEPIMVGNEPFAVSATIGIARSPYDGLEAGRLLESADAKMYARKRTAVDASSSATASPGDAAHRSLR